MITVIHLLDTDILAEKKFGGAGNEA